MKTLLVIVVVATAIFTAIKVIIRFEKMGVWDQLAINVAAWLGFHAKWELDYYGKSHICSKCHNEALLDSFGNESETLYCPYCGAKMRR